MAAKGLWNSRASTKHLLHQFLSRETLCAAVPVETGGCFNLDQQERIYSHIREGNAHYRALPTVADFPVLPKQKSNMEVVHPFV